MADRPDWFPVVVDTGSQSIKIGCVAEGAPDQPEVVPNIIVKKIKDPANPQKGLITDHPDTWYGPDALRRTSMLWNSPMNPQGKITDWDLMQKMWSYCWTDVVRGADNPVLLTEDVLVPLEQREKTAEIIFEYLGPSAILMAQKPKLALLSTDRLTSVTIVVDIGHSTTYVSPIIDGSIHTNAISKSECAGHMIDTQLMKMFDLNNSQAHQRVIQPLKEKLCYVAMNAEREEEEKKDHPPEVFDQSEGTGGLPPISVGNQRFQGPEVLFDPPSFDFDEQISLPLGIFNSISRCDMGIRKDMWGSILVCGGTSGLPGFKNRLEKELKTFSAIGERVRVIVPPQSRFCAWRGGIKLARDENSEHWFTADEYNEVGVQGIHKKVF